MIVFDARKLGGYDVYLHWKGSALFNWHSLPHALFSGILAVVISNFVATGWLHTTFIQSNAYFGGISFVTGFVVVYRAQIAYQRYDEAQRMYFQMVSKLTDFVGFLNAFIPRDNETDAKLLLTFLRWARAYHELAIEEFQGVEFQGSISRNNLTDEEVQLLARDRKRPLQLSLWMQRLIIERRDRFHCGDAILSRAYQVCSDANFFYASTRRIAESCFPFPFVQLTSAMIHIWMLLTPVVVGTFFPKTILLSFLIAMSSTLTLFAVNELAAILENPWEESINNLPAVYYTIAFDDDMSSIQYMELPQAFEQENITAEGEPPVGTTPSSQTKTSLVNSGAESIRKLPPPVIRKVDEINRVGSPEHSESSSPQKPVSLSETVVNIASPRESEGKRPGLDGVKHSSSIMNAFRSRLPSDPLDEDDGSFQEHIEDDGPLLDLNGKPVGADSITWSIPWSIPWGIPWNFISFSKASWVYDAAAFFACEFPRHSTTFVLA